MEIYLHHNGEQIGPSTEQQIRDMVRTGAISKTDFAWREGFPDWRPLNEIVNFDSVPPLPAPLPAEVPAAAMRGASARTAPSAQKPGFGLHPIVIVFFVLYALGNGFVAFRQIQLGGADQIPYSAGYFGGSVLGPLLFAYIAWLIFRRSRLAANIVCCLLVFGGITSGVEKLQEREAALRQMRDTEKKLMTDARKNLTSGTASLDSTLQDFNRLAQQFGSMAKNFEGNDKQTMLATQDMAKTMDGLMQKYTAAKEALAKDGFIDAMSINTREDLKRRRELAKTFSYANQQVADYYKNAAATYRDLLRKYNVSDGYADKAIESFTKAANINLVLQIMQTEADVMTQVNIIYGIYDREWGKWKVNADGLIEFQNSQAVTDYTNANNAINALAAKEEELRALSVKKLDEAQTP